MFIQNRFKYTWPPDKSNTANLPSEIAFNPIFHHLSRSSELLSSIVDTLLSGTGSIAADGSPSKQSQLATRGKKQSLTNNHAYEEKNRLD